MRAIICPSSHFYRRQEIYFPRGRDRKTLNIGDRRKAVRYRAENSEIRSTYWMGNPGPFFPLISGILAVVFVESLPSWGTLIWPYYTHLADMAPFLPLAAKGITAGSGADSAPAFLAIGCFDWLVPWLYQLCVLSTSLSSSF